jgi:ankyrin repeat protein
VLATAATLDVNAGDNDGWTPIVSAMWCNKLSAAKLLVENGANLFAKNQNGEAAIDTRVYGRLAGEQLGPQVFEHAKAIRWSAAKECILLSNAFQSPERRQIANPSTSIYDDVDSIKRSARLAASVLGDPGLSRLVASYILRTDIIVRDRSILLKKEPDEVKKRIEAALGSLSSGDGGSSSARSD